MRWDGAIGTLGMASVRWDLAQVEKEKWMVVYGTLRDSAGTDQRPREIFGSKAMILLFNTWLIDPPKKRNSHAIISSLVSPSTASNISALVSLPY